MTESTAKKAFHRRDADCWDAESYRRIAAAPLTVWRALHLGGEFFVVKVFL